MKKRLGLAILAGLLIGWAGFFVPTGDTGAQAPKVVKKHPRGYKAAPPAVRAKLHADAFKRHDHRMKSLPKVTAPSFDCRTAPGFVVLPVDDQGSCGDCFMISALDGASMALARAGILPASEAARLSGQYGLDCQGSFGGCGGGDEAQVIDFLKTTGWVLTSQYGPYSASAGSCRDISAMTIYKLGDWGYCTPSQQSGVASTQDMQNAIAQYGPISVAFDASGCDSYNAGDVMRGGGNNVDHAVLCIGWRTNAAGKVEFLGMNQWGNWGGDTPATAGNGCFWIEEGSYSWGTESIWMTAGTAPTPPPGPGPGPGPSPGPGPTPVPVGATVTIPAWQFVVPGGTFRVGFRTLTIPDRTIQVPQQTIPVTPAPMK